MDSAQVVACYQSLSQVSRDIRDAAAEEDWDRLFALDKKRQPLVATLKKLDASVALDDASRRGKDALIREILADEAETRKYVTTWMQQLDQAMREGRRELRLLREYAKNAG
jgi:flagellar protein FliT